MHSFFGAGRYKPNPPTASHQKSSSSSQHIIKTERLETNFIIGIKRNNIIMRISNTDLWLASALATSILGAGSHGFGVVVVPSSIAYGQRTMFLKTAATPEIDSSSFWGTFDIIDVEETEENKKLGIDVGHQLIKLSPQDELEFKADIQDSISSIVDAGMKEMALLSDRLKRDNANPHDLVRVQWDRAYHKEEIALRGKVDRLASEFLKDTHEQRVKVHTSALETSILKEGFSRRAEAASHGREYSPSDDISISARLLVRAKKALQGLLPSQGTWNEWDEWDGGFSSTEPEGV